MPIIEWSDALAPGYAPMDTAHRRLVALLAQAQTASDERLSSAWAELVAHTESQFADENRWMRSTRFQNATNHQLQHRMVLNLLLEGATMTRAGQLAPVREMAQELAHWLLNHTQSMDTELALHLQQRLRARATPHHK